MEDEVLLELLFSRWNVLGSASTVLAISAGNAVSTELVATPAWNLKTRSIGKDNLPILVCTSELVKHAGG